MGAHPYFYYVDYDPDIQAALDRLRDQEFQAGRYSPVWLLPQFPVTAASPSPGPQHATIEEVIEAADTDGMRSILDLDQVIEEPFDPEGENFGTVAPLDEEFLEDLFGTTRPTRDQVDEMMSELFEELDRGLGVYIIIYKDDQPHEIFFAGYSYD